MESRKTYQIEIKKDRFEIFSKRITNKVGVGWIVQNILGGLISVVIDARTGARYQLNEKNINAFLQKQQPHLFGVQSGGGASYTLPNP